MPLANSTNNTAQKFFSQVENLLVDMELMLLEEQHIDSTKIESVANKYSFVWKKAVDKKQS